MAIKNLFRLKKRPSQEYPSSQSSPVDDSQLSVAGLSINSSSSSVYAETHSHSNSSTVTNTSKNPVYEQYTQLSRRPDFPQELTPIVTLLNCQAARVYAEAEILLNVELNGSDEHDNDLFFQPAEATLRGTTLFLSSSALKPITLDLLEATVHTQERYTSLVLSTSHRAAHHLKFSSTEELQHWIAAIHLAIYEQTRLSLCYTASLLSSKATQLSDVHVVMSELKFTKEEWVNIKFSKNAQWLRCYMSVSPGDSKNKGTVSFYSSQRTTKKNLICSVSSVDHCYAVYPSVVELIDNSALIKLQGDVTLYQIGSVQNLEATPIGSPQLSAPKTSSHKKHSSISSLSSVMSSTSAKSTKGFYVHRTSLYILPETHGGVKPYETMIRVLMPIYDAFKLYGRPRRLVANKRDADSLLFALPSLPRVKILTNTIATSLVLDNWAMVSTDSGIMHELFDAQVGTLFNTDASHEGYGDLRDSIQKAGTYEHPYSRRASLSSTFKVPSTPNYTFSATDLPPQLSTDDLTQIQKQSDSFSTQAATRALRSASITSQKGHTRNLSSASRLRNESYSNLHGLMEPLADGAR